MHEPQCFLEYPEQEGFSIQVEVKVFTDFHRELVSEQWLRSLGRYLSGVGPLSGKAFRGILTSRYSESRFMGHQSVVKYRFELTLDWLLPASCPLDATYDIEVEYRPMDSSFKRLRFSNKFRWREGHPGAATELESVLLSHGIVVPLDLALPDIDKELVDSIDDFRSESHIVGVAKDADQTFAVFENLRALDSIQNYGDGPVTPAVLPGYGIQEIIDRFFGKRVEITEAVVPWEELHGVWETADDEALVTPELKGQFFRVGFCAHWTGSIKAVVSRDENWITVNVLSKKTRGMHRSCSDSEQWQNLLDLAQSNEVWNPKVSRCGLDGFAWILEAWDGRELYHWMPPYGAAVKFCLACFQYAGIGLKLQYFKSWAWESEISKGSVPLRLVRDSLDASGSRT